MHDCSGRRNGVDVDIEGWMVERRARRRPVSYNEIEVSLLPIIKRSQSHSSIPVFPPLSTDMACREGSKRSLTANLVVVSTGKPRSGEPTVAVPVINGPFPFCIVHLFLSSAGIQVLIDSRRGDRLNSVRRQHPAP